MLPYMELRNNTEVDSNTNTRTIRNDAGDDVLSATISDAAGVFTQGKLG